MLSSIHNDRRPPRNLVTCTQFPVHIDKTQPPLKKEPFHTIAEHTFCHTLSIAASSDFSQEELQAVVQTAGQLHYARVHMKLIEIVSGDFFNDYVKTGNICMLSEGRPGHDTTFSLNDGILRLEIDRPTYEKLGLDGKPVDTFGRKHIKARYVIELNLRLPSMVRGKKGFERVLWAFKNVLTDTVTWLFYNVKSPQELDGTLKPLAPTVRHVSPGITSCVDVVALDLDLASLREEQDLLDVQEWLSLAILDSPRIKTGDKVNPYLCRYAPPQLESTSTDSRSQDVLRAQWEGLIHPSFVNLLYISLLKKAPATSWLAISGHGFNGSSYTILSKDKDVIIYNFKD